VERPRDSLARHAGRPRALPDAAIAVDVARVGSELRAAVALLNSRYAWRGYRRPRWLPGASDLTLIATERGSVVGTLTLRFDGPALLRADESYGDEISAARSQGRGVCELGRFAVAENTRSTEVIAALFGRAREIVRERRAVTDVFVEVNPRHVRFYRRRLGFAVAGEERVCPRVLAPSVLLRLDVAVFERRARSESGQAAAWTQRVLGCAPASPRRRAPPAARPAAA